MLHYMACSKCLLLSLTLLMFAAARIASSLHTFHLEVPAASGKDEPREEQYTAKAYRTIELPTSFWGIFEASDTTAR